MRGVPSNWFKSYLSERSQHFYLGNTDSNITNITHDVQHGSVLLFILFVNDFRNASSKFKYSLFADIST